jgi:hypothetical protein
MATGTQRYRGYKIEPMRQWESGVLRLILRSAIFHS